MESHSQNASEHTWLPRSNCLTSAPGSLRCLCTSVVAAHSNERAKVLLHGTEADARYNPHWQMHDFKATRSSLSTSTLLLKLPGLMPHVQNACDQRVTLNHVVVSPTQQLCCLYISAVTDGYQCSQRKHPYIKISEPMGR